MGKMHRGILEISAIDSMAYFASPAYGMRQIPNALLPCLPFHYWVFCLSLNLSVFEKQKLASVTLKKVLWSLLVIHIIMVFSFFSDE